MTSGKTNESPANRLRAHLKNTSESFPFIGVYDTFSASLAARHFDGLFVSGFSFAASYYGLPDIGLIGWPDLVAFVQRLRTVTPNSLLLVDMDDGYADVELACYVARLLESAGAAGIILEDQKRPRRCGHLDGKRILDLGEYLEKLHRVLEARSDLFVIARTDASGDDEILRRVREFANAGADAVLADGIGSLDLLHRISDSVPCPVVMNLVPGGKSPSTDWKAIYASGGRIALHSTPCLFAAQRALDESLNLLKQSNGKQSGEIVTLAECNSLLHENLRASQSNDGK